MQVVHLGSDPRKHQQGVRYETEKGTKPIKNVLPRGLTL